MDPDWRRIPAFLIGCTGTRSMLTYIAYKHPNVAQVLAPVSMVPAIGWIYLSTVGNRDTGPEVFGGTIWWQDLRLVHAVLWVTYSYQAYRGDPGAWRALAVDTTIGLVAWLTKVLPMFI